jgi:hypothetical protein
MDRSNSIDRTICGIHSGKWDHFPLDLIAVVRISLPLCMLAVCYRGQPSKSAAVLDDVGSCGPPRNKRTASCRDLWDCLEAVAVVTELWAAEFA